MICGFSPVGALGFVVRVEVDIRRGLPGTDIVGLPSSEVREARERVRVAVVNSGFEYPAARVLVSLSPAEQPKVGSGFDLPIALAILRAGGQIDMPGRVLATGELSVSGEVIPVRGTLSAVLAASDSSIESAIVSTDSAVDVSRHDFGCTRVVMIERLSALRELSGAQSYISIPAGDGGSARSDAAERISFDDMHGQPTVKWACAVSAAGFHNVMLMGPPGSGKTMAARRVATLLPDLDPSESREVARLYSMRGLEASIPSPRPPMRMPHHGATMEGLLGGGRFKVPGEVSLSHRGVMILDEAAEFRPRVLQALREPVERRFVDVSRAGRADRFPSAFQLVMTSNLCPCGKLGRPGSRCMCSLQEVERYWRRLGAALLDRVELRVRTHYHESSQESPPHAELTDRVHAAVERQRRRYRAVRWKRNGLVPAEAGAAPIGLSETLDALLRSEMASRDLSDRAAAAVRRVARTIADIDDREDVQEGDVLEALALRCAAPD